MRRLSRDFEIFSVSALDLFASALGAFILIAIIIFPYYSNRAEVEAQREQLEIEFETARVQAENLRKAAAEAVMRAARAKAQAGEIMREIERLEVSEAANANAQKRLAALKKEDDKRVEFALLGLPVKSEDLLIVVDMSGSMKNFVPQILKALNRIFDPLDDGTTAALIGYQKTFGSTQFHFWPGEGKSRQMNRENKQGLYKFIRGLEGQFNGSTPTEEALMKALQHRAGSVILLSDGAPDWNSSIEPTAALAIEHIVARVTQANGGKKEIHTVAIGDYIGRGDKDRILLKFLTDLAKKNKGNFVGVSR